MHIHLAQGSAHTTFLCAYLLQSPGKQAFRLMPHSGAHHSKKKKWDFHSKLNASEVMSFINFFLGISHF